MGSGIMTLIAVLSLIGGAALLVFLKWVFAPKPRNDLDVAFAEAGFDYDKKQNIFHSRMDAWQRDYGYSSFYDDVSAPLGMIFDCEPVRFEYQGKHWLIEIWKGQYGMTTGFEIGVYTLKAGSTGPAKDALYRCADDDDMLSMAFIAKKNNRVLFKRSGVSWWLTGFMLGEFSEPEELSMDLAITFKDRDMLLLFGNKLIELGYTADEIKVLENAAVFSFYKPRSVQPKARYGLIARFSQWRSMRLCQKYRKLTGNTPNVYEAAAILKRKAPALFNRLLNMAKPIKLFKKHIPRRRK